MIFLSIRNHCVSSHNGKATEFPNVISNQCDGSLAVKGEGAPEGHGSSRTQARPEQGILFVLLTDDRNTLINIGSVIK